MDAETNPKSLLTGDVIHREARGWFSLADDLAGRRFHLTPLNHRR